MSPINSRLLQAHEQLKAATLELVAAHEAIPDSEFTPDIPSVIICGYDPARNEGTFTMLGNVSHAAQSLEKVLADPAHSPFRDALMQAIEMRILFEQ